MARFLRNIRVFTQPTTLWTRQPCRALSTGFTNSTQSTAFANKVFSNRSLTINPIRSCVRAFSCSGTRLIGHGLCDQDLATKLKEELNYEKGEEFSTEFVKNFKENNPFKIEDKPDCNTVTLTRTFGNERIRVTFDITNSEFEADPDEYAEKPENDDDSTSIYDEETPDEEPARLKLPYRCSVTIEKDNKGALAFDLVLEEGSLILEHVAYFADASLIDGTSPEAEWKRRSIYSGPTFDLMDDDIHRLFEEYLKERGINEALALFVPSYAEYREQQEYVKWLERVHNFLAG